MTEPHCHYTYEMPWGYQSPSWWPTPADAMDAARVHNMHADAKLITAHAPACACPPENGES